MKIQTGLTSIKGVGEKTAELFARLHITNVGELLEHYPRDYEKMDAPVTVSALTPGRVCAVRAAVIGMPQVKRVRSLVIATVQAGDATGFFRLTFFGMPYLRSILKPGSVHIFRGLCQPGCAGKAERPAAGSALMQMEQPAIFSPEEYAGLQDTLQPRYALTKGLTNRMMIRTVRGALEGLDGGLLAEFLPEELRKEYDLIPWLEAVRRIHCPADRDELAAAVRRLSFNEFLEFFLGLSRLKKETGRRKFPDPLHGVPDTGRLLEELPYRLTGAQLRVWAQIEADMEKDTAMNRLVQGDVGSGKTILAFLALLMCAANGRQGCLMAPTEVLAAQHFEALSGLCAEHGLCIRPALLTGSIPAREKKRIYAGIVRGEYNVIIGTHALIQEKVEYRNLALVITDEQHRFGVRQRESLADKGGEPHVLVMSATPIPRTLAIVMYGDLDVSILDEMPVGRLPIKNCVVGTAWRPKAYAFIAAQVKAGHQAYVICPMVEEGEMDGLENVTDYAGKLEAALPKEIRVGVLHGRMKNARKNEIMEAFAAGETDVLVSTTVIEVGINVPNATVMMVENAERFGLAQLHQLRGRVGRGSAQSYCMFISSNESDEVMKRLNILNTSNDGFFIANEDLKLRGPGDLYGVRQSGQLDFKIGDIYRDSDLVLKAAELAERIVSGDPEKKNQKLAPLYRWEEQHGSPVDFRSI